MLSFTGIPCGLADGAVGYGCFSQPIELGEALLLDHPGPIQVILCPDPWEPVCTVPDAPNVDPVLKRGTYDTFLPNELQVTGLIPNEGTTPFKSMRIQAQSRPDGNSPYVNLWSENGNSFLASRDAVHPDNRIYSGTSARYEATGLERGVSHRFRVAYCREESGTTGCTCWSDWTGMTTPSLFTSAPLSHQTPQLLEDYFDRRESSPKRERSGALPSGGRGDGLGPDAAWMDEWILPSGTGSWAGNGAQIAADTANLPYALIPMNGLIGVEAEQAQDPHSWAEIEFRGLSTSIKDNPNNARNYNIDLHARFLSVGTPTDFLIYSYMVKLVHEPDFDAAADDVTLEIYRNEGTPLGTLADPIVTKTLDDIALESTTDDCKDIAQLEVGDVDALLRIRVENLSDHPSITAIVAWGCGLTSCTHKCEWAYEDADVWPTDALYMAKAGWGVMSHHFDLRVDVLRVGSVLAP